MEKKHVAVANSLLATRASLAFAVPVQAPVLRTQPQFSARFGYNF